MRKVNGMVTGADISNIRDNTLTERISVVSVMVTDWLLILTALQMEPYKAATGPPSLASTCGGLHS